MQQFGRMRWVKLWTQETLYGTTSKELSLEQQAIWWKIVALAGDSPEPGVLCLAPGIQYPIEAMSKVFKAPVELVQATIDRCLTKGVDKLEYKDDCLKVSNFEHWQGDYVRVQEHRARRAEKQTAQQAPADSPASPPARIDPKNLATIKALWQANCGPVTPIIAKELEKLATTYKASWVDRAIEEAVKSGVKRLPYVVKILERYAEQGSPDPRQLTRGRPTTKSAPKTLPTAAELQKQLAGKKGESKP